MGSLALGVLIAIAVATATAVGALLVTVASIGSTGLVQNVPAIVAPGQTPSDGAPLTSVPGGPEPEVAHPGSTIILELSPARSRSTRPAGG